MSESNHEPRARNCNNQSLVPAALSASLLHPVHGQALDMRTKLSFFIVQATRDEILEKYDPARSIEFRAIKIKELL
jgi:hypothetical protein